MGQLAPDFTLNDTHGEPVQLSQLRGQAVTLVFFPFAFSGICSAELCEIRDNISAFTGHGARVLGISTDPMFTQRAWAEHEGFTFDLLSDFWPHGKVSSAFGVFDDADGHALRGSFLIDSEGIVRWAVVNPRGQARDLQGYLDALSAL